MFRCAKSPGQKTVWSSLSGLSITVRIFRCMREQNSFPGTGRRVIPPFVAICQILFFGLLTGSISPFSHFILDLLQSPGFNNRSRLFSVVAFGSLAVISHPPVLFWFFSFSTSFCQSPSGNVQNEKYTTLYSISMLPITENKGNKEGSATNTRKSEGHI